MRNKTLSLITLSVLISSLFAPALSYATNSNGFYKNDNSILVVMFGDSVEELAALDVIEFSGIEYTLLA